LLHKLQIGEIPLKLGFEGLQQLGFKIEYRERAFHFDWQERDNNKPVYNDYSVIQAFVQAVQEEQFMRQYFSEVSVDTIEMIANRSLVDLSENQKRF
jgi:single-stranded-DNA-specific exonuclease